MVMGPAYMYICLAPDKAFEQGLVDIYPRFLQSRPRELPQFSCLLPFYDKQEVCPG